MAIQFDTISQLPELKIIGSFDAPITGVSIDTRSLNVGDLFVAFIGTQVDGHDFIPKAISRGASAVMASTNWDGCESWDAPIPLIVTEDPVNALADLATAHRKLFNIPVIAITGTNGKTSTKNMLSHIMSRRLNVLTTKGNFNNHIGLPLTLLGLNETHDMAVIEMGASKKGDIDYLCQIAQPSQGLITNISLAHTEFFLDIDTIQKTKGELFAYLGTHYGRAFVNGDDTRVAQLAEGCSNPITFGYGVENEHKLQLTGPDSKGCYSMEIAGHLIRMSQPGKTVALNAAAASTIALQNGILYDQLKEALESYPGETGRMQLQEVQGLSFFNDAYNANPASVKAGLETFSAIPASGQKIIVLADMLELGPESARLHAQVGQQIIHAGFKHILLLGPESSYTADFLNSHAVACFHTLEKDQLQAQLMSLTQAGDLIYLKGSRGMALESLIQPYKDLS